MHDAGAERFTSDFEPGAEFDGVDEDAVASVQTFLDKAGRLAGTIPASEESPADHDDDRREAGGRNRVERDSHAGGPGEEGVGKQCTQDDCDGNGEAPASQFSSTHGLREEVDPPEKVVQRAVGQPLPAGRGRLRDPRLEGHGAGQRVDVLDTLPVTLFYDHMPTRRRMIARATNIESGWRDGMLPDFVLMMQIAGHQLQRRRFGSKTESSPTYPDLI